MWNSVWNTNVPPAIIIVGTLLCDGEQFHRNPQPRMCCKWSFGAEMSTETSTPYGPSPVPLKHSSGISLSAAVVTFEVAPHQMKICPHGMKVVTEKHFFLLITGQEVSDTCQNKGCGGGHGATYQRVHINTRLGSSNKTSWEVLFFKPIFSIAFGQQKFFIVIGEEDKQPGEGCG